MRYAASTDVSSERSRTEIESTLKRYGADQFILGWDHKQNQAVIGFSAHGRQIRFVLRMPLVEEFSRTPEGQTRHKRANIEKAHDQACRQRWRALLLVIKAKLEAVECGIATFEEEFMAWVVLPDGATVGEHLAPQIQKAYDTGKMPRLLPALPAPRET